MLPALALSALCDDPVDVLGLLATHRDLATAGGGRRRWLALPPPDPGVLDHAVEDGHGGVVVLRGLRWQLSRQVVPRPALAAGEGWGTARPVRSSAERPPARLRAGRQAAAAVDP